MNNTDLISFLVVLVGSTALLITYELHWIVVLCLTLGKLWYFLADQEDSSITNRISIYYDTVTASLEKRVKMHKYARFLKSSPSLTNRDHHLDAVRGISSIMVVLYHMTSPFTSFVTDEHKKDINSRTFSLEKISKENGTLMVPVFVCLSGFVLSKVYWGQQVRSLKSLLLGRIKRFFPLHWFAEAVYLPVNAYLIVHFYPASKENISASNLGKCLTLTHMWTYLRNESGWTFSETCNGPSWSLSIEWGINIIMFLSISLVPNYFSLFLFESIAYFGYYSLLDDNLFGTSYTAHLLYAFFVGCILQKLVGWFKLHFIPLQVICDIAIVYLLSNYKYWISGNTILWTTPFTSLLILLLNHSYWLKKCLSHSIFQFLGKISFSLYLTHQTVLNIFQILVNQRKLNKLNSSLSVYFMLILLILIAACTHSCIESRSGFITLTVKNNNRFKNKYISINTSSLDSIVDPLQSATTLYSPHSELKQF